MEYYDEISKGYNELYKEEQLNKISIIKNNILVNNKTKLLDVGCGTGISSDFGCFVVGIDSSIGLLNKNKSKNKINALAENIPLKSSQFDYVISVTAIHNFSDIDKSINEIKRVGKDNFVFSILKKSGKSDSIKKLIAENFIVEKEIEEDMDSIFFCKRKN